MERRWFRFECYNCLHRGTQIPCPPAMHVHVQGTVMELYGVPYLIFAAWLNLVTLMQHTDPKVSYFRGETWSYLRGALSTVDRTYKQIIDPFNLGYGKIIDHLHHNISDGHVVHHIFFTQIPHYNLKKATEVPCGLRCNVLCM